MANRFGNVAWGNARCEFFAAWPEIKALVLSRRSIVSVYRQLHEAGRITMSYRRFTELIVREMRAEQDAISKTTKEETNVEKKATSAPTAQSAAQAPPVQRTGPKIVMPMEPKPFRQSEIHDYRELV